MISITLPSHDIVTLYSHDQLHFPIYDSFCNFHHSTSPLFLKHLSFPNLAAPASFARLPQMSYASRRTGGASNQKKVAAERNQQILRTLMKDPGNKFCADCKVSGHPRWASWSLGIFVCIR